MKRHKQGIVYLLICAVFSLSASTACSADDLNYKSIGAFLAKHPHAVASCFGVDSADGGGYVEFVYDDVKAGVAVIFGTQDPDASLDDIVRGKDDDSTQYIRHKPGVAFRYAGKYLFKGDKVEREAVDPALRISHVRYEIAHAKTHHFVTQAQ